VSDHCASKVFLPERTTGIPHAHNLFLQVLADHGLVSLVLLLIALGLTFQRLFQGLAGDQGPLCRLALACALFILMSSLVESTLLKTSLQQVISGYLLAVAWMPGVARPHADARTIAP
jgi:O-antigen ligase